MPTYATLTNRRTSATTRIAVKTRGVSNQLFATARQYRAALVRLGATRDPIRSDTGFVVFSGERATAMVDAHDGPLQCSA